MTKDRLDELVPPGVDHREVLDLILRHYKSGSSKTDDGFYMEFPGRDECALRIRTKKGSIVHLEEGPALTTDDLDVLKEKIRTELVESTGDSIAAEILFSSPPVRGSFQCDAPLLQLTQAPPEAPQPPQPRQPMAEHPFILRFPVRRSTSSSITHHRRQRQTAEWAHILNVLLTPRITHRSWFARWSWVRTKSGQYEYAPHSYAIEGFQPDDTAFSPTTDPIRAIPDADYYAGHYEGSGLSFAIPSSFHTGLRLSANLAGDDRDRYLRAVQWFYAANAIGLDHRSSSYIALVAAIESLVPASKGGPRCSKCGRETGPGPTQAFREFLERYGPPFEGVKNRADELYTMRSKLAHGNYMLTADRFPHASFETDALREFESFDSLYMVVRLAILNWLSDSERS